VATVKRINELRAERAKLVADARALNEKGVTEKRDLNAEEKAEFDRLLAQTDKLGEQIKTEERLLDVERETAAQEVRTGKVERGEVTFGETEAEELRRMNLRIIRSGGYRMSEAEKTRYLDLRGYSLLTPEFKAYRSWLAFGPSQMKPEEIRSLNFGVDVAGGFTVPPEQFVADLIRKIDDYVFIRGLATKYPVVKAQDLGVPTLEQNPADADWTTELATGSEDTAMQFGKRMFAPHPLAKLIKISNKLLRASVIDIESLVIDRFAYKFAIAEEKAFISGSGAQQPLGLFTASANGISTARDISTGNSTTQIGADGLVNAFYNLKAPYRRTASWLFHRLAILQLMTLKDGDGQYLWKTGLTAGAPDMILGRPVAESEYVPSTFTTGLYVGMIGDYSRYWIADALDMQVQRLSELYAATNQTGFIGRKETDGMPVLEEAFVRMKLA
jgi:HK97 family phage major capsid protein